MQYNEFKRLNRGLGTTRDLTYKYVQIKQSLNEKRNLNDSAGLMNDKIFVESTYNLPPKYIETFDKCNEIINELIVKFASLQKAEQTRLMPKFDDDENKKLDKTIKQISRTMTEKVKQCDQLIKELLAERPESAYEEQSK